MAKHVYQQYWDRLIIWLWPFGGGGGGGGGGCTPHYRSAHDIERESVPFTTSGIIISVWDAMSGMVKGHELVQQLLHTADK